MKNYLPSEDLLALAQRFPGLEYDKEAAQPPLFVPAEGLLPLLAYLQQAEGLGLDHLLNLTAVDYKDYLAMVYQLYSLRRKCFVTVKVRLARENPVVPSITGVFPGAEFEEREVYDLMGIEFSGHPDLRRILMPDDYGAYPLRKDFVPPVPKLEGGKLIWQQPQRPSPMS